MRGARPLHMPLSIVGETMLSEKKQDKDIKKLAVEIDRRATKADVQDGFAVMNGKLDRMMTVLDRTAGELFDNRQSHTLFGAMIGDQRRILDAHDRRITGLESRFQP